MRWTLVQSKSFLANYSRFQASKPSEIQTHEQISHDQVIYRD